MGASTTTNRRFPKRSDLRRRPRCRREGVGREQDMATSLLAYGGAPITTTIPAAGTANTVEIWCCSVAAVLGTALALVSLSYLLWRIWVSSRARRKAAGGRSAARSLPAPVPVLPAWCGFLGGHSLIIKPSKVLIIFLVYFVRVCTSAYIHTYT